MDKEDPDPVAEQEVLITATGLVVFGVEHDDASNTLSESELKSGRSAPDTEIEEAMAPTGMTAGLIVVIEATVTFNAVEKYGLIGDAREHKEYWPAKEPLAETVSIISDCDRKTELMEATEDIGDEDAQPFDERTNA